MSWRVVTISSRAKLENKLGFLVVRTDGDVKKIHISEISVLVIESTAVSLTTSLLCELTKSKVKVIFCDEKMNPSSEIIPTYGSHDTSSKIKKQIAWSEGIKGEVWTRIVIEKICKQRDHLASLGLVQMDLLSNYIEEVQYADETNREGHAAKVYFNALFGKDYSRKDDNNINAALNYGYTILLSIVNREIVSNGYLTQLGLWHDNMFNQFNFSSDLMEPYRPLVDKLVIGRDIKTFGKEEKKNILNLLNSKIIIDGKEQYVNNAIKIYCKSIFDALNENNLDLLKFYSYEF